MNVFMVRELTYAEMTSTNNRKTCHYFADVEEIEKGFV